jgi:hypothetical protein
MNMQDNEMDDLFRLELGNFETDPSERVWTGIRAELDDQSSRSRSIWPLLRIAASIIVLATGGIVLVPWKSGTANKAGHTFARLAPPAAKALAKVTVVERKVKPEVSENAPAAGVPRAKRPVIAGLAAKVPAITEEQVPVKQPEQTLELANSPSSDIRPAYPVSDITITEKILIERCGVIANAGEKPQAPPTRRHGIHNIGDLVNLVVARVDKRKDKVIEFSDNEDDESTITGLNIGLIRIKKDK